MSWNVEYTIKQWDSYSIVVPLPITFLISYRISVICTDFPSEIQVFPLWLTYQNIREYIQAPVGMSPPPSAAHDTTWFMSKVENPMEIADMNWFQASLTPTSNHRARHTDQL